MQRTGVVVRSAGAFAVCLLGLTGAALAERVEVTGSQANLREKPTTQSAVIAVLARGALLDVKWTSGAWHEVVVFDTGQRGFIAKSLVRAAPAPAPEPASGQPARPSSEPLAPPPGGAETTPAAPPPSPVALEKTRPEAVSKKQPSLYLFANGLFQRSLSLSSSYAVTQFYEHGMVSERYPFDKNFGFEIGAQARLLGPLGVHVAYSSATRTGPVAVDGEFPHPFYFGRLRDYSGSLDGLQQSETAIHADVALFPRMGRLKVSLFAGVSLYSSKMDVLTLPSLDEVYPYDTVSLVLSTERSEAKPMGFNGGASADFLLGKNVGMGVQFRYCQAKARFEPTGKEPLEVTLGGPQASAGLRVIF